LDWLAECFGIHHIRISPYNSRANGIVKRQHRTICDSLVKSCKGVILRWPLLVPHIFWADRATTRKSTGYSPFYMVHGVEPVLPFDLTSVTFLVPNLVEPLSTANLLAICARQLQMHDDDLAAIHDNVLTSRLQSVHQFCHLYDNMISSCVFHTGDLVLVCNAHSEADLSKMKPRYLGPLVVLSRTIHGSYCLSELDGAVSKLHYAMFRLVPYHSHDSSRATICHQSFHLTFDQEVKILGPQEV